MNESLSEANQSLYREPIRRYSSQMAPTCPTAAGCCSGVNTASAGPHATPTEPGLPSGSESSGHVTGMHSVMAYPCGGGEAAS
jgi:hypothetical protein